MGLVIPRNSFQEKAVCLFKPAPYKIFHGGRGATKTWDFARASLLLGANRPLTVLHAREFQHSIKESVHKLLSTQIEPLGLDGIYEVQETEIFNPYNGTRHVFAGIRNNIHAIKSMEGIDLAIVYEATFISQKSWEVFEPTIRCDPPRGPFGQGSEIWIEFNPELASDYTYKNYVADPPKGAVVVEVNWRDNPWFPEILRRQKDALRKKDHDAYLTVWEGKTRVALAGAIYAKEYATAVKEGRIAPDIKLIRNKPVTVVFDLGKSDMCAFWVFQQAGTEHNAVDFYGNTGFGIDHFIEEMQNRKLIIRNIILPADAKAEHQSATRRGISNTIEKQMKEVYPGDGVVQVLPGQISKVLGINATRQLWPRLNFHEINCADGLLALQHYQYGVHPITQQRTKEPLHNWASNPADALRYYAVWLREGIKPPKQEPADEGWGQHDQNQHGWMAG